jgi:hypothetical protein
MNNTIVAEHDPVDSDVVRNSKNVKFSAQCLSYLKQCEDLKLAEYLKALSNAGYSSRVTGILSLNMLDAAHLEAVFGEMLDNVLSDCTLGRLNCATAIAKYVDVEKFRNKTSVVLKHVVQTGNLSLICHVVDECRRMFPKYFTPDEVVDIMLAATFLKSNAAFKKLVSMKNIYKHESLIRVFVKIAEDGDVNKFKYLNLIYFKLRRIT